MAEQSLLTKKMFERWAVINVFVLSAIFQSVVESKVVMREC
jgi:hypothetical protein